jgi:type IV pilus assembly protein PilC
MAFADLFASRPSTKSLAQFLRRLAIALGAGIDIRKALQNEAQHSRSGMRWHLISISNQVNQGSSLTDAIQSTGEYFPLLVRDLIAVGEQTGHLPEVLKQLAENYDEQIALSRQFWTILSWPLAQLAMSLSIVGFLIWISAVIRRTTGNPTDILGIGLTGESGLLVYLIFLALIAAGIFLDYRASIVGQRWVEPSQRLVLRLPMVGEAFRTLSIARFAWTLHLTLKTALNVKKSVQIALASTYNVEFTRQSGRIDRVLSRNHPIYEALAEAHVFPAELVHSVQVGEESGKLDETLAVIARQQLESARSAFALITRAAGWIVWVAIALLITGLIFRIFGTYVGSINEALKGIK